MDFTLSKSNCEKEVLTPQLLPLPEMSAVAPWGEAYFLFYLPFAVPQHNYEDVKHFRASRSIWLFLGNDRIRCRNKLLRVQDFVNLTHNFIYHAKNIILCQLR